MSDSAQIVWFKRDLRIHDHGPLLAASQAQGPIIPLYIVEPEYWRQPFASSRHWHFIHDCLSELRARLQDLGQPLIIRVGETIDVIRALAEEHNVTTLWAHEETADLWTFQRDIAVRKLCPDLGIRVHECPANGVVRRLQSRDDWSLIRNQRMAQPLLPKPDSLMPIRNCHSDALPAKNDPMFGPYLGQTQKGGRIAAVADLRSFLEQRHRGYLKHISSPLASPTSCSRLSAHLSWGSLSVREVSTALQRRKAQLSPMERKASGRSLSAFGSRLAWRCHFMQKLEDQPSIETTCMHPTFEGLRETEHNEDHFQAWANGQTGFPFIDACMRSLIATGWITFRMRAMLVSFASYQLWLDWRKTAPYMARLFTDYEPGIHYSQFQMQSGVTGINAMRVYNPIKQSQDQDPKGIFIRRWVPERRGYSNTTIHEPWAVEPTLFTTNASSDAQAYPAPIVDHVAAARQAKERISAVRRQSEYRQKSRKVFAKHGSRKRAPKHKPHIAADLQPDLFSQED